jgi:hypothetical protein
LAIAGLMALASCVAAAQSTDEHSNFEVAPVKPSSGASVGPPNSEGGPGTRYPEWFGTDTTLRSLLFRAYPPKTEAYKLKNFSHPGARSSRQCTFVGAVDLGIGGDSTPYHGVEPAPFTNWLLLTKGVYYAAIGGWSPNNPL